MPAIKKTPATKTAKKPVVKKVAAKRTTTAKTTDNKVQKGLQNALTKAIAKPAKKAVKAKPQTLPSAIAVLAQATTARLKAQKVDVTVKFSALSNMTPFKLGGRLYIKDVNGKAIRLPESVVVKKNGAFAATKDQLRAAEVVAIKAGELVARI